MRGPVQPVVLDVPVAIESMDQRVQFGHRAIISEPRRPSTWLSGSRAAFVGRLPSWPEDGRFEGSGPKCVAAGTAGLLGWRVASLDALNRAEYPRSSTYDPKWLVESDMGPNPLWL